jgi:hypothetical protein
MQSIYLDTAIATIFVFLLFSVIAFVIQERIASYRKSRGKMLEFAISEVFKDAVNLDFDVLLYEHPQVDLLRQTQNELPSYLPASNFATALIDIIGRQGNEIVYTKEEETGLLKEIEIKYSDSAFERFRHGVQLLKYSELKILLNSFLQKSSDYETLETTIVKWYDEYMNRVSGWYKKNTRKNLIAISTCLVLFFNIDAIYLVQNIFYNDKLRTALVAKAEKTVDEPTIFTQAMNTSIQSKLNFTDSLFKAKINAEKDSVKQVILMQQWTSETKVMADSFANQRKTDLDSMIRIVSSYGLPIGWDLSDSKGNQICNIERDSGVWGSIKYSLKRVKCYFENLQNADNPFNAPRRSLWTIIIGWIIAAAFISFGAPFWFDLLGKFVNIRRAGIKPADTSVHS